MTHYTPLEKPDDMDITKHLESLKTRLGFARFKLRNGWENNTLLDVESLWKERQRQMIDALPTPRFTQRDILDNRTLHPHYHYRTMLTGLTSSLNKKRPQHERRHSHQSQQEKKKAKLTRSLSTPTTSEPSCLQPTEQCASTSTSTSSTPPPSSMYQPKPYHHDNNGSLEEEDDDNVEEEEEEYHDAIDFETGHKRKRQITHTPPSPPDDKDSIPTTHIITPPRRIRSSLDYLSYAIAMTENQEPGEALLKHTTYQDTTDSDDSDEYRSAPPSPVTAAAEAMMMFGHHRP